QAVRAVSQPVLAPAGLPHAWKPTSQSLTGTGTVKSPLHLHIGFVTPKQQYAAVEETVPAGAVAAGRQPGVDINGRRWLIGHAARSTDLALTVVTGRTLVQVTGSAKLAE